jgi:hypothetical protein
VVGGCFPSIRVTGKLGQPSMVLVVPEISNPTLTVNDVALRIEKFLFATPAFLPACTISGQEVVWNDVSWAEATFNGPAVVIAGHSG